MLLSTERSYRAWLRRYCDYIRKLPVHLSSEQKLERFLTELAKDAVAASTQNQAFNAMVFFYQEVMAVPLLNIQALRARRPEQLRHAPGREDTLRLLKTVAADAGTAISLVVRLLYGCGLRVAEPLSLRVKDVDLEAGQILIRAGSLKAAALCSGVRGLGASVGAGIWAEANVAPANNSAAHAALPVRARWVFMQAIPG